MRKSQRGPNTPLGPQLFKAPQLTCTDAHTHTQTHRHASSCTRTYSHTDTPTYKRTQRETCIFTHVDTHTHKGPPNTQQAGEETGWVLSSSWSLAHTVGHQETQAEQGFLSWGAGL